MIAATRPGSETSRRRNASIAGWSLLAMALLAPFAEFLVVRDVVVRGDAAATVANIVASERLFRSGVAAFLLVAILDVVVAWALHGLLAPVARGASSLAAMFRVAYAAVFTGAVAQLLSASRAVGEEGAFGRGDVDAAVASALASFRVTWDVGLVLFGIHLLLLGLLLFRFDACPRLLAALVLVAGAGYVVDAFGTILSARYDAGLSAYTFVGEALLMIWLAWKGLRGFSPARDAEGPR